MESNRKEKDPVIDALLEISKTKYFVAQRVKLMILVY
jgi:hypothetical protein